MLLCNHAHDKSETTKRVFARVRDVQEAVLILVLFVDGAHQRCRGREHLVDKDKDGLLGSKLDSPADHIDELAHCEIRWHQILFLVDRRDVGTVILFTDDRDAIRVFLADALSLVFALLE